MHFYSGLLMYFCSGVDKDETKATNNTPQEGRNNRRTLLITGGKLGCRLADRTRGPDFGLTRLYVQVQIDQSIHCIWRLCTSNFLGERAPLFLKSPN